MSDMSKPAPGLQAHDPVSELRRIGERRRVLQEVVKVTLFIARLHKSLHAVLLMGQPASQIPKQVLQSYEKLSTQTQMRSNADLIKDLAELDKRAQQTLQGVVGLAANERLLADVMPSDINIDELFQRVGVFKRTVQTAVAIRLLLRERGHKAAPLSLPIPLDEIQRHIDSLKGREQLKREKMVKDVTAMLHDVDDILDRSTDMTDAFRQALNGIKRDLLQNLTHLRSGRDIERMPMAIEWIEMGGGDEAGEFDKLAEAVAVEPAPESAPPVAAAKKPGFLRRLIRWWLSPLSVTWQDTKEKPDDGDRGGNSSMGR